MNHRILFASAILSVLAGCDSSVTSDDGSKGGCTVGEDTHAVGDTFSAPDGCNSCTCQEGQQIMCTAMACGGEGGSGNGGGQGGGASGTCNYAGVEHAAGDTFPSDDGCNGCSCGDDGMVACTAKACAEEGCEIGGVFYPVGSGPGGCGACFCLEGGGVACTDEYCGPVCPDELPKDGEPCDAEGESCSYAVSECSGATLATCGGGKWLIAQPPIYDCAFPACPDAEPTAGSPCNWNACCGGPSDCHYAPGDPNEAWYSCTKDGWVAYVMESCGDCG